MTELKYEEKKQAVINEITRALLDAWASDCLERATVIRATPVSS